MSPIYQGTSSVAIHYGNLAAAPTSPAPTEGSTYWETDEDQKFIYDGTDWHSMDMTTTAYTGGSSTNWWKSEGIQNNDTWNAEKGGKNLTENGNDDLVYTASDSDFNNHKSLGQGGGYSRMVSTGSNGHLWNAQNEGYSAMAVIKKSTHYGSFSTADGMWCHVEDTSTPSGTYGHGLYGDHIWSWNSTQRWGDSLDMGSEPRYGIYLVRFDSSGHGDIQFWGGTTVANAKSNTSWTTVGTYSSGGWPDYPASNSAVGISLFNFMGTTSGGHRWSGKIAEFIYWKGSKISDTERDLFKDYAKPKFFPSS